MSTNDANKAKLELAEEYGLQAKFNYQGEGDFHAKERRVLVESVDTNWRDDTFIVGQSFDASGYPEGYRSFRLDRIDGKVAIR